MIQGEIEDMQRALRKLEALIQSLMGNPEWPEPKIEPVEANTASDPIDINTLKPHSIPGFTVHTEARLQAMELFNVLMCAVREQPHLVECLRAGTLRAEIHRKDGVIFITPDPTSMDYHWGLAHSMWDVFEHKNIPGFDIDYVRSFGLGLRTGTYLAKANLKRLSSGEYQLSIDDKITRPNNYWIKELADCAASFGVFSISSEDIPSLPYDFRISLHKLEARPRLYRVKKKKENELQIFSGYISHINHDLQIEFREGEAVEIAEFGLFLRETNAPTHNDAAPEDDPEEPMKPIKIRFKRTMYDFLARHTIDLKERRIFIYILINAEGAVINEYTCQGLDIYLAKSYGCVIAMLWFLADDLKLPVKATERYDMPENKYDVNEFLCEITYIYNFADPSRIIKRSSRHELRDFIEIGAKES